VKGSKGRNRGQKVPEKGQRRNLRGREFVLSSSEYLSQLERMNAMKHFSPLCSQWHGQVKQLFTILHGHQTKVLAMFVLGAIKA